MNQAVHVPHGTRIRLLAAAVDFVAAHGVADLTLRRLAAAIGTSHRMLIYHFGSKEGLLVAVIREVEARQRAALAEIDLDAGSLAEVGWRLWRRLSDPTLWPLERLFFEVYGQALQGRPGTTAVLEGVVDSWVELGTELAVRRGVPRAAARVQARAGLAVTRGLLLDLLATGDRKSVDRAMKHFLTTVDGG